MMRNGSLFARHSLKFSYFKDTSRGKSTISMPNVKLENAVDPDWKTAKPYSQIPGPRPLPLLGNTLRFLPMVGEYSNLPMAELLTRLREKYGDVVKLTGVPGQRPSVFLFDPNDCEKLYRREGPWPIRHAFEAMVLYRERRPEIYKYKHGIGFSQGEEWYEIRSKVSPYVLSPRKIPPYIDPIDKVASDFIDRIRDLRDTKSLEMPAFFLNELHKWALESMCVITLGQRMGCLESNLTSDSEAQILIKSARDLFVLTYKLESSGSLWKLYETKDLKIFFQAMDNLARTTGKYVNEAKLRFGDKPVEDTEQISVLKELITILDEHTTTLTLMDLLIGAVDTTGNAAGTMIYYLATNPEAQEKLRKEATEVLSSKSSPVTLDTLNNVPYLKAVVKESMRLTPNFVGNIRATVSDIVIGGYRIPKGNQVLMCNSLMSRDPRNFPDELKFIPERWLKESADTTYSAKNAHPFTSLPFGFGPRMCIGKRLTQLESETFLIKLLRNFRLEWHHEPMKFNSGLATYPESPLRVKMIDI